ncbi:hypothetical protein GJ496_008765 [Pomphorhynchus laevis]|nr:hypothetical protein GJ496_008765 [Pomphorhynchus laevis]
MSILTANFQVFGRVQGVFFRKYAKLEADKHRIYGWIRNTSKGTVEGYMEGQSDDIHSFKHWLSNVGTPNSRIDKVEFYNEKTADKNLYDGFIIKR